jgi:hypothetical protein
MSEGRKRDMQGRLHEFGDLGVQRPLYAGELVKTQYRGMPTAAWYTGTAHSQNADGTWRIVYDDGGNPFDRVWPPTTSGDLQPIFSCVDSHPPAPSCSRRDACA